MQWHRDWTFHLGFHLSVELVWFTCQDMLTGVLRRSGIETIPNRDGQTAKTRGPVKIAVAESRFRGQGPCFAERCIGSSCKGLSGLHSLCTCLFYFHGVGGSSSLRRTTRVSDGMFHFVHSIA